MIFVSQDGTNIHPIQNPMKQNLHTFRSLLFTLLVFFLISGCEEFETNQPNDIQLGKEYRITSNLAFTIDSIREYRCPKDVVCIWAGDVDLFLQIREGIHRIDTVMRLVDPHMNPILASGYEWEVLDVFPYPVSDHPADPEDIRIRMNIASLMNLH